MTCMAISPPFPFVAYGPTLVFVFLFLLPTIPTSLQEVRAPWGHGGPCSVSKALLAWDGEGQSSID